VAADTVENRLSPLDLPNKEAVVQAIVGGIESGLSVSTEEIIVLALSISKDEDALPRFSSGLVAEKSLLKGLINDDVPRSRQHYTAEVNISSVETTILVHTLCAEGGITRNEHAYIMQGALPSLERIKKVNDHMRKRYDGAIDDGDSLFKSERRHDSRKINRETAEELCGLTVEEFDAFAADNNKRIPKLVAPLAVAGPPRPERVPTPPPIERSWEIASPKGQRQDYVDPPLPTSADVVAAPARNRYSTWFEVVTGEKPPEDATPETLLQKIKEVVSANKEAEKSAGNELGSARPSDEQLASMFSKPKKSSSKAPEEPVIPVDVSEVLAGTVSALEGWLDSGAADAHLAEVHGLELSGKNRSTALSAIESRIKEVSPGAELPPRT
jgi:hypothetical protein